jgi:hypothetical protein
VIGRNTGSGVTSRRQKEIRISTVREQSLTHNLCEGLQPFLSASHAYYAKYLSEREHRLWRKTRNFMLIILFVYVL